jgi:hypothetical protein
MAGNPRARAVVTKAIEQGLSYQEMAEICGVSEGSVKRWFATGRANSKAIEPLVKQVGAIQLNPQDIGNTCITIYKNRKKRFSLEWEQLRKLAGRVLTMELIDALAKYLDGRGYLFREVWSEGDKNSVFIMISLRQLKRYVKENLQDEDIKDFYIPEEEDLEEEE